MSDFFRFPHTPHIVWLGSAEPRDDKVLSVEEVDELLSGEVLVEEKLDGANVGLSLGPDGEIRAQNRGQYIEPPYSGQFTRLPGWLATHEALLKPLLLPHLIVFGEWCAARHSLDYSALPDWFVLFDVYDRESDRFWSSGSRDAFARAAGLESVPCIARRRVDVSELLAYVSQHKSCCRDGSLEGVVVRRESGEWCEMRGKIVRADFTQAIGEHWRSRGIEWNRVLEGGGLPGS